MKRRRHEEYLELKKKEEADPALAEAFKRRRMEEKARKAEAKKAKEREEEENDGRGRKEQEEQEEQEEQDESLMELELEGIRAARKGSIHHRHASHSDDGMNTDSDSVDDDDDNNNNDDNDDIVPVYRGLKGRIPSMLAIVSGGADGNLVVYNVESRREVNTFKLMGFPGFYNPVVSVSEHHACLIVCEMIEEE